MSNEVEGSIVYNDGALKIAGGYAVPSNCHLSHKQTSGRNDVVESLTLKQCRLYFSNEEFPKKCHRFHRIVES